MTDPKRFYPADIVLAPEWWHRETGLTFDEAFFYHPLRRVEAERRMERELYERWGQYGLGAAKGEDRPEIGAVHLAAGFLISELLGCEVEYSDAHPPQVNPGGLDAPVLPHRDHFAHPRFRALVELSERLKERYGFLTGDINWGGVLNIALDLRGEALFLDSMDVPEEVDQFFTQIGAVIDTFTAAVAGWTGTTSISVNRNIGGVDRKILLHSQCSHTMISVDFYRRHLMKFDQAWSRGETPYGIHYCGSDPHRFADAYSELPSLAFLDVGWGGDVRALRQALPNTFLNIRLDPVSLVQQSPAEIEAIVERLAAESGDPALTGFCCVNIDDSMPDENITAIFRVVEELQRRAAACYK